MTATRKRKGILASISDALTGEPSAEISGTPPQPGQINEAGEVAIRKIEDAQALPELDGDYPIPTYAPESIGQFMTADQQQVRAIVLLPDGSLGSAFVKDVSDQ